MATSTRRGRGSHPDLYQDVTDRTTALSLFPLTAPTAMVTRLSTGAVPPWQPIVALAGLVITAYLFVLLASRFFRADTLLSSASLDWRRVAMELRGR